MAVARAAFPCPEVPLDQVAGAAGDARTNIGTGAGAQPFTLADTVCWMPGFTGAGCEGILECDVNLLPTLVLCLQRSPA